MNAIVERFTRLSRDSPDRPLIHVAASDTTLTAAYLWESHVRHRACLSAVGVRSGGIVLSAGGNRAGTVALLLASWAMGATVIPVDASTPAAELDGIAARFHASAIAVPSTSAAAHSPGAVSLDDELSILGRDEAEPSGCRGAALLKVTSGSAALPKAVPVNDAHIIEDTRHVIEAMGIRPDDVQLAVIPLSHAYGFGNLVMPMLLQGTPIVLREAFVPQLLPSDARRFGARIFPGVPFMFQYFVAHPPPGGWPGCLQLLISAGAPLDPMTIVEFHQRFGIKVHSFYGSSESGGIAFDSSDRADGEATVGWTLPGVTVTLIPGDGIPAGYGRVHVRSAAVAAGYVADGGGGEGFVDGGFLTDDYGSFMPDGRLALAGRIGSFINVAGRKVHPGEVERVLRSMDGIGDAAVVAASDPVRGEQIAAVLVGAPGVSAADVRRHCAPRLAPYKIPRLVIFVDVIPVTARGKTDQRALDALVAAHLRGATGIGVL